MVAVIASQGFSVPCADFFCGFGGSSQGIEKAGAEVRLAANHNELAIRVHAANFPHVDHRRADLVDKDSGDYQDPAELPGSVFAWFSPGCTHHSPANAKKIYARGRQALLFELEDFDYAAYAKSERSRVTMSCVLRYAERHKDQLRVLVVENVIEVCKWGPDRDGSTFQWWLRKLKNIGYEVELCFFNSQFFPPCPQSRDRVYIVAWRKGNKRPDLEYRPPAYCTSERCCGRHVEAVQSWKRPTKAWPLPRWGKYGSDRQYVYRCPDCAEEVFPAAWPAYTAIDWSNLGPALCEREGLGMDPLADATVARMRRALTKFSGLPPVIIPAKSVWGVDRPVWMPLTTQTTQQEKALVSAGVVPQRTGNLPLSHLEQLNPVTTSGGGGHALVTSAMVPQRRHNLPNSVFEQMHALTTFGDQNVASVVLPNAGNTYESGNYVRARHVSNTLFTQHTSLAFGFASMQQAFNSPGLFAKFNGGPEDTAWHPAGDPLNTVTTADTHGLLMMPWFHAFYTDPGGVTRQLAEAMAELRRALAYSESLPLEEITDDELAQVRFRMLEPDPELRRAMAFADDYILLGNRTQVTAGLGNAVTPPVAEWLTERCLATLRG
jgi:DNA (cytosine-5)-methyltransferase 1